MMRNLFSRVILTLAIFITINAYNDQCTVISIDLGSTNTYIGVKIKEEV